MNMKTCFILLAVLILVVSSQPVRSRHAIIPYESQCQVNQQQRSFVCRGKGQSADFTTRINPNGGVRMSVEPLRGSISMWQASGTVSADNEITTTGNFTFGVHNTHNDHVLYYSGTGIADLEDQFFAVNAVVHGGAGAWEGASGVLSMITQHVGEDKYVSGAVFFVDPPHSSIDN
eukprot:TRINITY_DN8625_c0_g1_i1.p1 TRINITY_DN8625_c0_g1~~TRINITY_DN8625_c0_g1_i1.p1  ORF type:complete len:175 (-),score=38.99 TRINITY_DN8625_c0_g1_i1:41-565(-)